MFERDFDEFVELLDGTISLNPNWKPLQPVGKAIFFKAMEPYSLEQVTAALTAHIRDTKVGMFQPTPAHLIAQIQSDLENDGRPGVEQAWAMLPHDEHTSTGWTQEMAEAWGAATPLLRDGDKIGARMAFKEVYSKLVAEARSMRRPVKWVPSFGVDPAGRVAALENAVRHHRLSVDAAVKLLPSDAAEGLLLSLGVKNHPLLAAPSQEGQKRVRELLLTLKGKTI